MQHEVAAEVLRLCRRDYIDTCIETSAYAPWEHLEEVAQYCNMVFVDLKHIDSARHREITGVPNERILDNICRLCDYMTAGNRKVIVRHPVVPGYNDEDSCTEGIARFVDSLAGRPELNLLPYHNLGELKYQMIGEECEVKGLNMMSRKDETILHIVKLSREYAPHTRISVGGDEIEQ